jgi:replicative DNA helicase
MTRGKMADALERELPNAPDAERAVLGSMLLDAGAIPLAVDTLGDAGCEAFFSERHRLIYEQLVAAHADGDPIDAVVFKQRLLSLNLLDKVGGVQFLGDLLSAVPSADRVQSYARVVLEQYIRRELIEAAHVVSEEAFAGHEPPGELIADARATLDALADCQSVDRSETFADMVSDMATHLDDPVGRGVRQPLEPLAARWPEMLPGEMCLIGARTSVGKTALMLTMALNQSVRDNVPAIYLTLEMSKSAIVARLVTLWSGIATDAILYRNLTTEQKQTITDMPQQIANSALTIERLRHPTIERVGARIRSLVTKHGARTVYLDYAQKISGKSNRERRQIELGDVSRTLHQIGQDCNVNTVIGAQLNRVAADEAPKLHHFREAGDFEQDADIAILIHRPDAGAVADGPEPWDRAILTVAKNRTTGRVGDVECAFMRLTGEFRALQAFGAPPDEEPGDTGEVQQEMY